MQKRLAKLVGATILALLMLSFLVAAPVRAANPAPPSSIPPQPVWITVNALPQGNYAGGNEIFDIFVVNSEQPPNRNITLFNETITAPALPAEQQSNTAIGLPIMLSPGQAILNTIALPIPSDFKQTSFTANLVAYVFLGNQTTNPIKLTGSTQVTLLGLPGTVQTTSSTTTQSTQSSQAATPSGTVSTTLFLVGVALPSIVVVILLILLVRGKSGPK